VLPHAQVELSQLAPAHYPLAVAIGSRTGQPWAPLRAADAAGGQDLLNPLLQALSSLQTGEEALFQILVRPAGQDWARVIHQETTRKAVSPLNILSWGRWPHAVIGMMTAERQPRYAGAIQRMCEQKHAGPHSEAVITLGVYGSPERVRSIVRTCAMALSGFTTPLTGLSIAPGAAAHSRDLARSLSEYHFALPGGDTHARRLLVLTPSELAGLWHLPSTATTAENVSWTSAGNLMAPLPAVAPPRSPHIILGAASRPDGMLPIALLEPDRRGAMLILGKTGTGKTCFMENMIVQDLAAGRGVALIDRHGDMTPRLLGHIPTQRVGQTVVIDTSSPEGAVALNPLALAASLGPSLLVGELIEVFRVYFGDLWSVGRMEDTMRSVLWALMARPGHSLGDVGRLFHDPVFRQQLAQEIPNPVVKEYWLEEFAQLSAAQQHERSGVLLNKVRAFLTDDSLRAMLTAPTCLDIRRLMDSGGILFVRPVGLGAPESTLLCGLVASLLFAASRSRADTPAAARRPCYLYLDEAQTLTSSSLPAILAQGRKFGLICGGLALQYLDAFEPATRQALMGNASTFVVFRCGPNDARLLQPVLDPVHASDLENLDRYQAVCKMQRNGATLPTFGLQLPDPIAPGNAAVASAVMAASRQRYGLPAQETNNDEREHNQPRPRLDDPWQAT
jgi:hypothetical protein